MSEETPPPSGNVVKIDSFTKSTKLPIGNRKIQHWASESLKMFSEGQLIGHYHLVRELGRGSFGSVWLAEHRTSVVTTQVAIKLPFRQDLDANDFQKEASAWTAIGNHANVLPLVMADFDGKQPFMVSPYIQGGSLHDWMLANQPGDTNTSESVQIASGILRGLGHLHQNAVLHRDLKPANILMQGNHPLIADFGLARLWSATLSTQTPQGTPLYMAPELWESSERYPQSDIWSVGVILYELLHRRLPFDAPDMVQLSLKILKGPPPPIDERLPTSLRLALRKALARAKSDRFQTTYDMLAAIQQQASGPQVERTPPRTIRGPDELKTHLAQEYGVEWDMKESITISDSFFEHDTLATIQEFPPGIVAIKIRGNWCRDTHIKELAELKSVKKIELLGCNRLTGNALKFLAQFPALTNLSLMTDTHQAISRDDLKAAIPLFPKLRILTMSYQAFPGDPESMHRTARELEKLAPYLIVTVLTQ